MTTQHTSKDQRKFDLATKDHNNGKWTVLLESESRETCKERLAYLLRVGVRTARLYLTGRTLKEKIPHSIRPNREPGRINTDAYIAWLLADRSRVAYVFPWSDSLARESDRIRRKLIGRGIRIVEVCPADYLGPAAEEYEEAA